MIGDKVYRYDPKTNKIHQVEYVGEAPSEGGYRMVSFIDSKGKTGMIEDAHIHATLASAEAHMKRVTPLILQADCIIDDAKSVVDDLRIRVIGEPQHADLAKRIKG